MDLSHLTPGQIRRICALQRNAAGEYALAREWRDKGKYPDIANEHAGYAADITSEVRTLLGTHAAPRT
jgi:hypothetical protein